MDIQNLETLASEIVQQFESGEVERHELLEKVRQTLGQMRAFGMPLPDDLVASSSNSKASSRKRPRKPNTALTVGKAAWLSQFDC